MIRRDPKLYRDGSVGGNRRSRDRWTSQPSTKPDVINGFTSKQIEGYVNDAKKGLKAEAERADNQFKGLINIQDNVDNRINITAQSPGNKAQGHMASQMAEELLASAEPSQEGIVQENGKKGVDTLHAAIVKDIDELFALTFEKSGIPREVYYVLDKLSKELDDPNLDLTKYQTITDNFAQIVLENEGLRSRIKNIGQQSYEATKNTNDFVTDILCKFLLKARNTKEMLTAKDASFGSGGRHR